MLDVSSENSVKTVAKDGSLPSYGKVDILVNNAGITRDALLLRMKRADWDDVLATNLTGAFLLTQALIPSMMRARWGRVINDLQCRRTHRAGRTGELRRQQSGTHRFHQIARP